MAATASKGVAELLALALASSHVTWLNHGYVVGPPVLLETLLHQDPMVKELACHVYGNCRLRNRKLRFGSSPAHDASGAISLNYRQF